MAFQIGLSLRYCCRGDVLIIFEEKLEGFINLQYILKGEGIAY